jgi:hypothetical protein
MRNPDSASEEAMFAMPGEAIPDGVDRGRHRVDLDTTVKNAC